MNDKKRGRGGARAGAGRKKTEAPRDSSLQIRLKSETRRLLDERAKSLGTKPSTYVAALVEKEFQK